MEDMLAGFISFMLVGWCAYCFFTGATGKVNYPVLSDQIDIGYVRHSEDLGDIELKKLKREVQTLKLRKDLEKLQKDFVVKEQESSIDPKLVRECESALVTLGFKKKEAKQEALNFLKNKPVDSVEQFVVEYFKKDKK